MLLTLALLLFFLLRTSRRLSFFSGLVGYKEYFLWQSFILKHIQFSLRYCQWSDFINKTVATIQKDVCSYFLLKLCQPTIPNFAIFAWKNSVRQVRQVNKHYHCDNGRFPKFCAISSRPIIIFGPICLPHRPFSIKMNKTIICLYQQHSNISRVSQLHVTWLD